MSDLPSWLAPYIGIPFTERGRDRTGGDCWAIPYLLYRDHYGITLPAYTEGYATTTDEEEIGAMVRRELPTVWRPVALGEAQEGDLLIIRMRGQPMHCAIVVRPPWFLHLVQGAESCLERWDSLKWTHRILGVYRHAAMLGVGASS